MVKTGFIYQITSPSGRIYIGQTVNLKNRISCYKTKGAKGQHILDSSLKKYGWGNHELTILDEPEVKKLNDAEQFYISICKSYNCENPMGMNLTIGGGGILGKKMTQQQKEANSLMMLNNWNSSEYRKKQTISHTGYKMTDQQHEKTVKAIRDRNNNPEFKKKMDKIFQGEEFREKQRQLKLGKKMSDEHRRKTSEASKRNWQNPEYRKNLIAKMPSNKGVAMSEDQKQKLREINLGKKHTDESKEKNRIASTGRKHTDDAKKKISEAKKKYYSECKRTQSPETIKKRTETMLRINAEKRAKKLLEQR